MYGGGANVYSYGGMYGGGGANVYSYGGMYGADGLLADSPPLYHQIPILLYSLLQLCKTFCHFSEGFNVCPTWQNFCPIEERGR